MGLCATQCSHMRNRLTAVSPGGWPKHVLMNLLNLSLECAYVALFAWSVEYPVTMQVKATEQYFHVMPFNML